jgi:hypothetical protein
MAFGPGVGASGGWLVKSTGRGRARPPGTAPRVRAGWSYGFLGAGGFGIQNAGSFWRVSRGT